MYVVDTGVSPSHTEFQDATGVSRVIDGLNMLEDNVGWRDCNGHGTHCASGVAGRTCGVDPTAQVISVRVLDCNGVGTYSDMIAGLEYVVRDVRRRPLQTAVISMSLGGAKSVAMNTAVNNVVAAGIPVVVAAGNENPDACMYSPSIASSAITVAASTRDDRRASFSNYGRCVDIVAPGQSILGASYARNGGYVTMSGTSMACPLVAGAVARHAGDGVTGIAAARQIVAIATPGAVPDAPLLYVGATAAPPTPTPVPVPMPTPVPVPLPIPAPIPPLPCATQQGRRCVFPFIFMGVRYTRCTSDHDPDGRAWCSFATDVNNNHVKGQWGHCMARRSCFCADTSRADTSGTVASSVQRREECSCDHGQYRSVSPSTYAISATTLSLVCIQIAMTISWLFAEWRGLVYKKQTTPNTPTTSTSTAV